MKIRREIVIGLVAILSIAVLIWGFKFLKGRNILSDDQSFYAIYKNIDQLSPSSPVLINGYEVGTVTKIKLLPERNNNIRVDFTVKGEIDVPKGTQANIVSQSIMGGKVIELRLNGFCDGNCLESGSQLDGEVKGVIESMLSVNDMKDYIATANNSISGFIDTLDNSLQQSADRDGVGSTVTDIKTTLENIKRTSESLDQMMEATSKSFPSLVHNLNSITSNIKSQNDNINATIANLKLISDQLKDTEIKGTVDKAGDMMESANTTIANLQASIKDLNTVINNINSKNGSLGKLIHDDELYLNLEKSSASLDRLLMDIKARPSRYVRFSVFGGKNEEPTYEEMKENE